MLLTIDNLTYRYKGLARPALDGVSFSASSGEYLAVLGANGSGKSTLARCITGLIPPDSGDVRVLAPDRIPSALVFQSPGDQIVAETVELDIAFGPENIGLDRELIRERVAAAMDDFSLIPLADAGTNNLPTGGKQLLALAGVLVLNPAVLVLDEPTSMLTQTVKGELLARIGRFHLEGGTVIHITHDLEEAFLADRILVMNDGVLAFDGTPIEFSTMDKELLSSWGLSPRIPERTGHRRADTARAPVPLACRELTCGPLRGFSAEFPAGSITAITGESGSGKTLLLETLAGLRAPTDGTVESAPGQAVALAVQESEASLFEEFVADDVAFGPRNMGLSGRGLVERVSLAMDMSGLPFGEFADRRTFTLSGGERRKAALAGIIAMNTPVILLDEPSSALDIRSRGQLLALLSNLASEGRTVVFTTNRPEECRIADQVLELPVPAVGVPADFSSDGGKKRRGSSTRGQQALERLRSGSRGSYVKLDTPIHRLSPLSKYLLAFSGVAAALAVQGWPWLVLAIALSFIPAFMSRIPASRLLKGFLKILPWLVLLSVLQYLFSPGSLLFLFFLLRFALLYLPLSVFVFSASHTEIMYGMEDLLAPIRLLGLPARDVSLVTGIVFRFIPLLYGEAERIVGARAVRQAGAVSRRGPIRRIQSMASLFIPLILRTLIRAERLAEAITARYYGSGKHTRYLVWKTGFAQRSMTLVAMVLAGALIALSYYLGAP